MILNTSDRLLVARLMMEAERAPPSLERMLCGREYFGLETATPVQRAISRICEGRAVGRLIEDPDVKKYIGPMESMAGIKPKEFAVFSGVRTAKSLFSAALAVHATQVCDASGIRPGEVPRVSIISLSIDNADVIMMHLEATILEKPKLRKLLVGDPKSGSLKIRQASTGQIFEIKVVAGKRAGGSVVSRWSAGLILDEAARMLGAGDGVVNMDDISEAVRSRLLPGAQIIYISSPWAPFGPAYRMVKEFHGKPTRNTVVIRCPADVMNPYWWTEERKKDLKERDEDAYRTDVLAEFRDQEEALLSSSLIEACSMKGVQYESRIKECTYYAAMDPATRSNAWSLLIGTEKGGQKRVVFAKEWRGTRASPLDPGEVLEEIAGIVKEYGIKKVMSDQWSADALKSIAKEHGISIIQDSPTGKEEYQRYKTLQTYVETGALKIIDNQTLKEDMNRITLKVTQSGISVVLPKTSDGRHCDSAPALAKLVSKWMMPEKEKLAKEGTRERIESDEAKRKRELIDRMRKEKIKKISGWDLAR